MSNANSFGRKSSIQPSLPRGDVLGTYDTYLDAQKVVDRLSKADFEVKKLAIVGNDLKTVERVTGKLTYGRTALAGAATGAWFGLFIGLLFFIMTPDPNISFVAAAPLVGAGAGMLLSVVTYSMNRKRRDFTSTHQVLASNYQVIIDPQLTARANELLAQPEPTSDKS
ncbi:MAG: general stress protein [Microbacteriaceae bacterium]